jgi:ankyrin repeat protein
MSTCNALPVCVFGLQNERGVTPLGIAVGFNRVAVVSLLLEKGAAVDKRDPAGNTVLHYAAGERQ